MARGGDQVKLAKDILEGGDPQDESDIPKEVPPEADRMVDPDNVMRGYEATVSNPSTFSPSDSLPRHLAQSQVPSKLRVVAQ
jgi:hypothetical protein